MDDPIYNLLISFTLIPVAIGLNIWVRQRRRRRPTLEPLQAPQARPPPNRPAPHGGPETRRSAPQARRRQNRRPVGRP